jgi:recombination protein RecR
MKNPQLENLIKLMAKIPGLGPRSARRAILQMLTSPKAIMLPLAEALSNVAEEIVTCSICGNIDISSPCNICCDHNRDVTTLCIVETVADLWAIERANFFKGKYHVLGGTLSAIEGRTPDTLNIKQLQDRVSEGGTCEVIIATNATLEGQTTGYYILDLLKPYNIKATRLAHGIPMGGELDYMDEGTLTLALKMRYDF